ncbi:hypothetical protein [Liquorilactobacillus oeni]|nr:hypothetical protein [Liquorilactobacillus oeni]
MRHTLELTFAYRGLDLPIKVNNRDSETGLNKVEKQLFQAKGQLHETIY